MAEPTPASTTPVPALPSTTDDTSYAPVSWVAAAALGVSVLFALLLTVLAIFAFVAKKPLLEEPLLALPVVAIILCFAARRTIQNSEGTRTSVLFGIDLVKVAFWISLVLGLCYLAYLVAIAFAIRRDAESEAEKWMGWVNKSEEDDVRRAFHRTLPPGERKLDADAIEKANRDRSLMFRTSDLLRLAQRNKGELKYESDSITWAYRPGMTECLLTGTVTCPEGKFPISMSLKGVEAAAGAEGGGGRQWVIGPARMTGYMEESKITRTPYGWLLYLLERNGADFGAIFVKTTVWGPASYPFLYQAFIAEKNDLRWLEVARDPIWSLGFTTPMTLAHPNEYKDYTEKHFFKLLAPEPKTDFEKSEFKGRETLFQESWKRNGIRPAGDKLKSPDGAPIDKENLITITSTAVEIRVPIEVPIEQPGGTAKPHARGHLVVECKDPKLLEWLKELKKSADPSKGTIDTPPELLAELTERFKDPANPKQAAFNFRVVRIESDMMPIVVAPPQGPGGPGGPGGR